MTESTTPIQVDERALTSSTLEAVSADGQAVGTVLIVNEGVPTQVANPSRATLRTIVQAVVGILVVLVPLANVVLANLIDYLGTQTDLAISPVVFVYLNAALAVTAFVIGLVARLMATPGVNEFIKARLPFLAPIPLR